MADGAGPENQNTRDGIGSSNLPLSAKKLKVVRMFGTRATERYSLGGRVKDKAPPKPTLPRLKYLEEHPEG